MHRPAATECIPKQPKYHSLNSLLEIHVSQHKFVCTCLQKEILNKSLRVSLCCLSNFSGSFYIPTLKQKNTSQEIIEKSKNDVHNKKRQNSRIHYYSIGVCGGPFRENERRTIVQIPHIFCTLNLQFYEIVYNYSCVLNSIILCYFQLFIGTQCFLIFLSINIYRFYFYSFNIQILLMKILFALIASGLLVFTANCVLGVDVSQLFTTATYQCMKSNGYSFAIVRGYCSYGAPDSHAVQSLTNAKNAGLITDIYMFPCRGKSATSQVDEMVNAISGNLYGMVWIDVETNPSSGCSWSGHDAASNCQFVMDTINRIKSHGKKVGVYASSYMWQTIMGSKNACTSVASAAQLWYAHYDGSASFSDYTTIGGWSKPNIKQYQGDTTLCGAGVDKNFYP